MQRTGAQILWNSLVQEGVTTVFGYPGGAILPAYDALLEFPLRHVLVRHEQSAVHMADGYARASGGVGVAVATSGPGATNLVTGIATAMLDSSPVVCITGQVASHVMGTDAFQEIDITGITIPVTKHNRLVTRADDVGPAVREAFEIAPSGRPGPVLIDITKDAQRTATETGTRTHTRLSHRPPRSQPQIPAEDLQRASALIRQAKRPLILAGRGVMLSGATAALQTFAERTNTPVAVTLLGIGALRASHPLNLGMMGMHGEAWVNEAIQQADLLLAFGMRFDDRVTGDPKTYAPEARKVHADIDRAEIGKNVPVDAALVGDLAESLKGLLDRVKPAQHGEWLSHINEVKGEVAVRDIQHIPDSGHLYAAHVIHDIWRITNGRAVVTTDVGQHQMWEAQYLPARIPGVAHHIRWPGNHGLWAAGGGRREAGTAGCRGVGHRRRRWVPDDAGGAGNLGPGAPQDQHRDHQQRISRNGSAVAGVFLRQPILSHPDQQSRLCKARRRTWTPGPEGGNTG